MAESSGVSFREGDKLKGMTNYYVWALKMRAILRAEGHWGLTEEPQTHTTYPVTIDGEFYTEAQLKKKRAIACRLILLSVTDDLIDLIAEFSNPALVWKTLKEQFHSGDQSQILTLMSQLQSLKLTERGAVDEYLKKARELKNRLGNMGEKLSDRNVNQIVLNGLPRSYESTIQTLSHLNASMTFEQLSASLMSESHRREHRNQKLGEDEALAATQTKQERHLNQGQGRGNHWQQSFRGRGYPMRGRMGNYFSARRGSFRPPFTGRPPVYCFNCGKPGHFARDCRLPKQSQRDDNASEGTTYANSAECFDSYLAQSYYYDPYYYGSWDNSPWYLDSGATGHIAADYHKLDSRPSTSGVEISEVKTGGGESHAVMGQGSATVRTPTGEIKLKPVKYVPSMTKNLISVGAIADCGNNVIFSNKECWIVNKQGDVIGSGLRDTSNGLYCFKNTDHALSTIQLNTTTLWHRHLGHLNYEGLYQLSKSNSVYGLPHIDRQHLICQCCLAGRQHRERFPRQSDTRVNKPGVRIHSDIIGPMQKMSLGGSRFILVFTDDYSRKSWVYFLKHKSETFCKFRKFKSKIELETGSKIQLLRTDRGGEYLSNEFKEFCATNGIHRELTQSHTPQQNGVSERRNRTIMERARSISHDCKLPIELWTEAVATATYLINKSPTRANHGVPPDARYFNKKPDVSNLRIFGCMAYVHIPKEHRQKLDSKTQRCLFLGYDDETKAYRLYDHIKKRVIISRDVIFDESKIGYQHLEITEFEDDSLDFPLTTGEGESTSCPEPAVTELIEVPTFQTPDETDHESRVQVDNLNTSRPLDSSPMQSQNSPTT